MAGHPSIPDLKKNQGVVEELIPVIEEHVSQTPAQQDAKERTHGDEICDLIGPQVGISILCKTTIQQDPYDESRQIRQPIPTDTNSSAEMDQKGTQIMNVVG